MRFTLFLVFLCISQPALAYIGPGLGVALVWTLLGPIAAVITTIALIAYFPLRYLYKKRKAERVSADKQGDQEGEGDDI